MQEIEQPSNTTKTADVEIVFLNGERKGQAQAFVAEVISFGRSPECNVVFKGAALTVSRVHARIVKKASAYYLENIGPNGSFVNGKPAQHTRINSGDVIQFSASGPSVRFISHQKQSSSPETEEVLTLHVGDDVHRFENGRILFGSDESCNCVIKSSGIAPQHAEIVMQQGRPLVNNLADQDAIFINGRVQHSAILEDGDLLQIGREGPRFKYLGAGKLIKQSEKLTEESSDELRTYIIPAPRPSLLDKLKRPKD